MSRFFINIFKLIFYILKRTFTWDIERAIKATQHRETDMINTFEISFLPTHILSPLGFLFFYSLLFFLWSSLWVETLNSTLAGTSMFLHLQGLKYQAKYSIHSSPFHGGRFTESWVGLCASPHCCVMLHPSIVHFHFLPVANRTAAASFLAHVLLNISEAKRRIPGSPVAKGFLLTQWSEQPRSLHQQQRHAHELILANPQGHQTGGGVGSWWGMKWSLLVATVLTITGGSAGWSLPHGC